MPIAPAISYTMQALQTLYKNCHSTEFPVSLQPSTVYPFGTILGEVTGASAVYTLALASASAGTFTITFQGQTITPQVYNVSAANLQAALQALPAIGSGNITVTLSGTTYTITFAGALANQQIFAGMTAVLTGITGGSPTFVLATAGVTATGTFGPYAHGGSGGLGVPVCAIRDSVWTDALGNISAGIVTGQNQWGQTYTTTPAFFAGVFGVGQVQTCSNLVGVNSNLIADAQAGGTLFALMQGSLTKGIISIGANG